MKRYVTISAASLVIVLLALLLGEWHGRRSAARYYLWDSTCIIHHLAEVYADPGQRASAERIHSQMVLTNLERRIAFLSDPLVLRVPPSTHVPYPSLSAAKEKEYVSGLHRRLASLFAQSGNLLLSETTETGNPEQTVGGDSETRAEDGTASGAHQP